MEKNKAFTLRLCSLLGENVETFNHFINHYRNIGVTDFHIVIHLKHQNDSFYEKAVNAFKNQQLEPDNIYIGPWNGATTTSKIYNAIKKKYPNDWFIVADQDEFQLYPKSIQEITYNCEEDNIKFITGCLIDRFAKFGKLSPLNLKESIWTQFPLCGFVSFPLARANPYKITLSKGNVILSNGQHGVVVDNRDYPITNQVITQVHHFKWTSRLVEKLKSRLRKYELEEYQRDSYAVYKNELKRILFHIKKYNGIDTQETKFLLSEVKDNNYDSYIFWDKVKEITKNWKTLQSYIMRR